MKGCIEYVEDLTDCCLVLVVGVGVSLRAVSIFEQSKPKETEAQF
jgi:hypothetical protein